MDLELGCGRREAAHTRLRSAGFGERRLCRPPAREPWGRVGTAAGLSRRAEAMAPAPQEGAAAGGRSCVLRRSAAPCQQRSSPQAQTRVTAQLLRRGVHAPISAGNASSGAASRGRTVHVIGALIRPSPVRSGTALGTARASRLLAAREGGACCEIAALGCAVRNGRARRFSLRLLV